MGVGYRSLVLLSAPFLRTTAVLRLAGCSVFAPSPLLSLRVLRLSSVTVHSRPVHVHVHAHAHSHAPRDALADGGCTWPEWSRLVQQVTSAGYDCGGPVDYELSGSLEVCEEFAKNVAACMSFARDRPALLKLLSKKDIKVVVDNISPFLFKNGSDSMQRLVCFLNPEESTAFQFEKAQTVDIMQYLTSYAYDHIFFYKKNDTNDAGAVEASVRNLIAEIVDFNEPLQKALLDESIDWLSSGTEQLSRAPRSIIQMKRGEWICSKCNFINFAKNMRCLECEEARPKRLLTGGEWECPQCDFFNYGRNMACLRCDCKCPVDNFSHSAPDASYGNIPFGSAGKGSDSDSIFRSLNGTVDRTSDSSNVENISSNQVTVGKKAAITQLKRDSSDIPFVPLRADMFKNYGGTESDSPVNPLTKESTYITFPEKSKVVDGRSGYQEFSNTSNKTPFKDDSLSRNPLTDNYFPEIMPMRKGENRFVVSKKKDRSLTSPQYKKRVAAEQANGFNFVPFVPFPPGYFARKDNRPESSLNDQEGSNEISSPTENSPPETPKTSQLRGNMELSGVSSNTNKVAPAHSGENNTSTLYYHSLHKSEGTAGTLTHGHSSSQPTFQRSDQSSTHKRSSNSHMNIQGNDYNRMDASPNDSPKPTQWQNKVGQDNGNLSWCDENNRSNAGTSVPLARISQGSRESSSRKSLEGSAVTEPDPLDMSEEAKAQRWFRRVSQITDISELANIPDEDFPQIMPMRKGVNRFVVSKRKTPLERRLTSPQYRRNLPIVRSEPEKDSSNHDKI